MITIHKNSNDEWAGESWLATLKFLCGNNLQNLNFLCETYPFLMRKWLEHFVCSCLQLVSFLNEIAREY